MDGDVPVRKLWLFTDTRGATGTEVRGKIGVWGAESAEWPSAFTEMEWPMLIGGKKLPNCVSLGFLLGIKVSISGASFFDPQSC